MQSIQLTEVDFCLQASAVQIVGILRQCHVIEEGGTNYKNYCVVG